MEFIYADVKEQIKLYKWKLATPEITKEKINTLEKYLKELENKNKE